MIPTITNWPCLITPKRCSKLIEPPFTIVGLPGNPVNEVVVTPALFTVGPVGGVATVAELNPPNRHGVPALPSASVNVGFTCLKVCVPTKPAGGLLGV